jgi:hypothetical protein
VACDPRRSTLNPRGYAAPPDVDSFSADTSQK